MLGHPLGIKQLTVTLPQVLVQVHECYLTRITLSAKHAFSKKRSFELHTVQTALQPIFVPTFHKNAQNQIYEVRRSY